MTSLRKFAKRILVLLNVLLGILFLLACCNAFLHPDRWWFVALLAFIFPLLLIILLIFIVFWLFVSPRFALISAICLITGWQNIHAFFGFSLAGHDFKHKNPAHLRIMTWNVRRWDEFSMKKNGSSGHRLPMLTLVEKQNADILCFQEFYEPLDSAKSNIRYIRNNLGYPYFFFSRDYHSPANKYETGVIIFSKYPIVGRIQAHFSNDSLHKTESLIAADIDVNGKTIRVFTTHLQSVLFKTKDFRNVEIIQNAQDSIVEASRSLVKKLKNALGLRGYQADTVRKRLDSSPFPLVICGDFNDVPNSYSYFHIRGNLQDAFIAKCFGIGRSYKQISPTLRIDYILPSKDFRVIQSMKLSSPYSDHNAMLTDLQLQDHK
jgi:endonuclease/exonuclease/phosphatase family metal-dependent hydrolase